LAFKTLKVKDENIQQKFFSNFERNIKIKEYSISSEKKAKNKQKGFITKNSFVFCRGFKKGFQYLEKMDKREMRFQKQLLNLRGIKEDYNDEIETINNYNSGLYKDKVKEEAKFVYLKIKDKIDDKLNINNNLDIKSANSKLKKYDQMNEVKRIFKEEKLSEEKIIFPPTYKYNKGQTTYNGKRTPSWTDRILHKEDESIKCIFYDTINLYISDHKPLVGLFQISLK
jgi:hypothetical protein